jgi:hypothetical protein
VEVATHEGDFKNQSLNATHQADGGRVVPIRSLGCEAVGTPLVQGSTEIRSVGEVTNNPDDLGLANRCYSGASCISGHSRLANEMFKR